MNILYNQKPNQNTINNIYSNNIYTKHKIINKQQKYIKITKQKKKQKKKKKNKI